MNTKRRWPGFAIALTFSLIAIATVADETTNAPAELKPAQSRESESAIEALPPLAQLLAERAEAAGAFYDATKTAFAHDTVTLDQLIDALGERLDAELDAAQTPKERITARKRALIGAFDVKRHIRQLFDAGQRGGEAEKWWQVNTTLLSIEIGLLQEWPYSDQRSQDQNIEPMVDELLDAARARLSATQAAYSTDTVTLDLLLSANRAALDASLLVAKTAGEREGSFDQAILRLTHIEKKVSALHDAGVRGGEEEKFHQARHAKLDAELAKLRDEKKANQAQRKDREADAEMAKILHKRLIAARLNASAVQAAYDTDTVTLNLLINAYRRRLAATLDVAKTAEDVVDAYRDAVNALINTETGVSQLYKAGACGGEADKLHLAQSARLQAQIGLARALQTAPADK